jgi:hypothetical protein
LCEEASLFLSRKSLKSYTISSATLQASSSPATVSCGRNEIHRGRWGGGRRLLGSCEGRWQERGEVLKVVLLLALYDGLDGLKCNV